MKNKIKCKHSKICTLSQPQCYTSVSVTILTPGYADSPCQPNRYHILIGSISDKSTNNSKL